MTNSSLISARSGLLDHHSINVDVRNVGLTPFQCEQYNLPQSLQAAKKGDPNYDRWIEEYPDQAPTELDALHPEILQQLVTDSLDQIYDTGEISKQKAKEIEERLLLKKMRRKTSCFLGDQFPEYMQGVTL